MSSTLLLKVYLNQCKTFLADSNLSDKNSHFFLNILGTHQAGDQQPHSQCGTVVKEKQLFFICVC